MPLRLVVLVGIFQPFLTTCELKLPGIGAGIRTQAKRSLSPYIPSEWSCCLKGSLRALLSQITFIINTSYTAGHLKSIQSQAELVFQAFLGSLPRTLSQERMGEVGGGGESNPRCACTRVCGCLALCKVQEGCSFPVRSPGTAVSFWVPGPRGHGAPHPLWSVWAKGQQKGGRGPRAEESPWGAGQQHSDPECPSGPDGSRVGSVARARCVCPQGAQGTSWRGWTPQN